MKYFVTLALLASVIVTTAISVEMIPQMKAGLQNVMEKAGEVYPEDLVITAKDGAWSINKEEPYSIAFPIDPKTWMMENQEMTDEMGMTEEEVYFPSTLIVFDHEGEINDLEEHDTLMLVNAANIIVRDAQKIEVYPLGELPDGEFTQATFDEMLVAAEGLAKYLPGLLVALMFVMTFMGYFVFRSFALVFVAVAVWFLSMFSNNKLNFADSYRVGIHTMTLPLVISIVLTVLQVPFVVPLWFFAVNVIYSAAVVFGMKSGGNPGEIDASGANTTSDTPNGEAS